MFNNVLVALDMGGCSKKCKFCTYLKQTKSSMTIDDLHLIYELITPFTNNISVSSFYKEIDILPNYLELLEIENKLNDFKNYKRLNNINIDKVVNDKEYINYLNKYFDKTNNIYLDVFGNRSNHDYFKGRAGSFNTLLKGTEILKQNNFKITWIVYLNKQNISDINYLNQKKNDLEIELIYKQPLPINLAYKNISYRLTKQDINRIPTKYNISLGIIEKELYAKFLKKKENINIDLENIELLIDNQYNMYIVLFNKKIIIGNIKKDSIMNIFNDLFNQDNFINYLKNKRIDELTKEVGNELGNWIFNEDEYLIYLIELSYQNYIKEKRK